MRSSILTVINPNYNLNQLIIDMFMELDLEATVVRIDKDHPSTQYVTSGITHPGEVHHEGIWFDELRPNGRMFQLQVAFKDNKDFEPVEQTQILEAHPGLDTPIRRTGYAMLTVLFSNVAMTDNIVYTYLVPKEAIDKLLKIIKDNPDTRTEEQKDAEFKSRRHLAFEDPEQIAAWNAENKKRIIEEEEAILERMKQAGRNDDKAVEFKTR